MARKKKEEEKVWEKEVKRVGTGHRVRREERESMENPGKKEKRLVLDLVYTDIKKRKIKEGLDVELDKNRMVMKLKGKGKEGRQKRINTVVEREKRRKVSEYTGCGIMRKEKVGAKKLKPTKARAK